MAQKRSISSKRKVRKVVSPTKLRRKAKDPEQEQRSFPAEGMARCISNEGMENDLNVGEVVYIREIPNMGGHCVVLRNMKVPLVGYHLDRFELLKEDDDSW